MHRRIVSSRGTWLDAAVNFEFRDWLERDRDDREVRMYIEMGVFG